MLGKGFSGQEHLLSKHEDLSLNAWHPFNDKRQGLAMKTWKPNAGEERKTGGSLEFAGCQHNRKAVSSRFSKRHSLRRIRWNTIEEETQSLLWPLKIHTTSHEYPLIYTCMRACVRAHTLHAQDGKAGGAMEPGRHHPDTSFSFIKSTRVPM